MGNFKKYKCLLCGRDKFRRIGQPHKCNGQFRKSFKKIAEKLNINNVWIKLFNENIDVFI
jgi:hypothetical protein